MTRGAWAFIVGAVVVSACSSSSSTTVDATGACRAIAGACHKYDKGSGVGHDCHELGHAGDDTACAPKTDECLAACPVIDGGADHPDAAGDEAGAADGGADAQPDAPDMTCPNYCDCVGTVCSSQTGYPYANGEDCLAKCKQLSAAETKCWTGMCESGKTSVNKEHLCEHAWGKFGLDECE